MSSTCNVTTVVVLDVFFKLIAISDNCLNSEISKITELTEVSFQELPEIGTFVLSNRLPRTLDFDIQCGYF